MAAEQLRGEPVRPAADLVALGIMVYEMATGRFPWQLENESRIDYISLSVWHLPSQRVTDIPEYMLGIARNNETLAADGLEIVRADRARSARRRQPEKTIQTAAPSLLSIPGSDTKYVIEKKIGEGRMAEVFLGRTVGAAGFERMVAIKRVRRELGVQPGFGEMFVLEA